MTSPLRLTYRIDAKTASRNRTAAQTLLKQVQVVRRTLGQIVFDTQDSKIGRSIKALEEIELKLANLATRL